MFAYSAINSMGWALANEIILAIPMIFSLLLVFVAMPVLWRTS
jgi:flagellar biosynthesis protein FliR